MCQGCQLMWRWEIAKLGFHSSSCSSQKIIFSLCFFLFFFLWKKGGSQTIFLPSIQLQNLVFLAIIHPVLILACILCVHVRGVIRFATVSLSTLFPVALAQKYTLGVWRAALESELLLQFLCLWVAETTSRKAQGDKILREQLCFKYCSKLYSKNE